MSLSARIRRAEAQREWLDTWGEARCCDLSLGWLEKKEQVEACLARDPGHQRARWIGEMMGIDLPPRPEPPKPRPEEPRETRRLDPRGVIPALRCEPTPRPSLILRDASRSDAPQDEVVRAPPKAKPPPEPSQDIPEHMQIRPTNWRQRDASDVDDWEDGGPGSGQCLTEYDPLAEHDDDS